MESMKQLKIKQRRKRRVSNCSIRYSKSCFVRKYANRKSSRKSWFWSSFFEPLYFVWKRSCKSWLCKRNWFLIPPHPLLNFEIQKYYQNEPRFHSGYSRNNLPKTIQGRAYVINLDEYADVGTYWIALFCNRNKIVYFDSFGVEHVPEEIKKFIGNKSKKQKHFSRTNKQFNNVQLLSHWIH